MIGQHKDGDLFHPVVTNETQSTLVNGPRSYDFCWDMVLEKFKEWNELITKMKSADYAPSPQPLSDFDDSDTDPLYRPPNNESESDFSDTEIMTEATALNPTPSTSGSTNKRRKIMVNAFNGL